VVSLIVFCAVIGMFLAVHGLPPAGIVFFATLGIALVAGAAAAVNCLVEQKIDAVMQRTRMRPLPRGELTSLQTLVFAGVVGGAGLWLLYRYVNPLTMWLTLATFVGYAVNNPEAGYATEHRDRRRVRRDAAGARLGGGRQRRRP
jgi:protoheme IX farnesyltransferase